MEQREWNVVFLLDNNPPQKIVLLKRVSSKSYAPNFYTGIGGKVDPEDKSIESSAYRELKEETGVDDVKLNEIARCIIDNKYVVYYFWGVYKNSNLPKTEDGELEWVDIESLFDKEIIPTTRNMLEEWKKRGFKADATFTVNLKELGVERTVKLLETVEIREGLFGVVYRT